MKFKIIKKTTSSGTRFFARRKFLCFWLAVETFTYGETIEVDFATKEGAMDAIAKYVADKSLGTVYEEEIIEC